MKCDHRAVWGLHLRRIKPGQLSMQLSYRKTSRWETSDNSQIPQDKKPVTPTQKSLYDIAKWAFSTGVLKTRLKYMADYSPLVIMSYSVSWYETRKPWNNRDYMRCLFLSKIQQEPSDIFCATEGQSQHIVVLNLIFFRIGCFFFYKWKTYENHIDTTTIHINPICKWWKLLCIWSADKNFSFVWCSLCRS